MSHEARKFAIEKALGVTFKNARLLMEALTHPSFASEDAAHPVRDFGRLEFLGDTVLQMEVTEAIYGMFRRSPEGDLTLIRSALVCNETIGRIGMELNIDAYAYVSCYMRMNMSMDPNARSYLCACLFEAIIGALYLDQGHDACSDVIRRHIIRHIEDVCEDYRLSGEDEGARTGSSVNVRISTEETGTECFPIPLTPVELDELVRGETSERSADVMRALSALVIQHFPKVPTFSVRPACPIHGPNSIGMFTAECRICGFVVTRSFAVTKRDAVLKAADVAFRHFAHWKDSLLLMMRSVEGRA